MVWPLVTTLSIMGWKMLISYLWKSRENLNNSERPSFYALLNPSSSDFINDDDELNSSSSSKKYGPGSPAFRRKGLLRRQG